MSRVLVIDDDSAQRLVLRSRLAQSASEVVLAESGARGLALAASQPFDVVLVAARLGAGVNGFEVCKRLKQRPEHRHVPVILFNDQTGVHEDLARAYEAGCDAYISKPDLPALEHVLHLHDRYRRRFDEFIATQAAMSSQLDNLRRDLEENGRGGDSERALRDLADVQALLKELALGRPDGVVLVDVDGAVRLADRGACELLGRRIEGTHLASLVPTSGLEAFVRDAHVETHDGLRFDVPARKHKGMRSLTALVVPLLPRNTAADADSRIVLLFDSARRRLAAELARLGENQQPQAELSTLREAARTVFGVNSIRGPSAAANLLRAELASARADSEPVLLVGPEGSGRRHAARVLHYSGAHSTGAFEELHCAAHSAEHLELELFGLHKGTNGAILADRPGALHRAQDGTLHVTHVEDLPSALQTRLVRFLDEGTLQRRGATKNERFDVRVVCSTSIPLATLAQDGRVIPALAERLVRRMIMLPALSERVDDIDEHARHFLARAAHAQARDFEPSALAVLRAHAWPRNLADLAECVEHAVARGRGAWITLEDLPRSLADAKRNVGHMIPRAGPNARAVEGTQSLSEPQHVMIPAERGALPTQAREWDIGPEDPISFDLYEKKVILRALNHTHNDKLKAARLLGVGKSTLYRKLKKYDIH